MYIYFAISTSLCLYSLPHRWYLFFLASKIHPQHMYRLNKIRKILWIITKKCTQPGLPFCKSCFLWVLLIRARPNPMITMYGSFCRSLWSYKSNTVYIFIPSWTKSIPLGNKNKDLTKRLKNWKYENSYSSLSSFSCLQHSIEAFPEKKNPSRLAAAVSACVYQEI